MTGVRFRVFYKGQSNRGMATKAAALQQFRYNWKVSTKGTQWADDVVAKREAWNNYTDSLCKEGYITSKQYHNWTNPF